jgi:hypothetical protein
MGSTAWLNSMEKKKTIPPAGNLSPIPLSSANSPVTILIELSWLQ